MPKFGNPIEIAYLAFLVFAGYFVVHVFDDNRIAAQVAIALVFVANILTGLAGGRQTKRKVRELTAAFLLGALGALMLA